MRDRRRKRMPLAYTGSFDLADEVAAIVKPLAGRVAALPRPASAGVWVDAVAGAVHETVSTIVGWLAEADAYAKTTHLAADPAKRHNAIRLLVDLAPRPPVASR